MSKKLRHLMLLPNGAVAAFDENDQQIGELQTTVIRERINKAIELGYDVKDVQLQLPSGRKGSLFFYEDDDGKQDFNYNIY